MNLVISRLWPVTVATVGMLTVNGADECFTLELPIRDGFPGSAISSGTYPIKMRWSARFERPMPHVDDVPGRTAIEIHDGNTVENTDGCILVGNVRLSPTSIGESRAASDALNAKIQAAQDAGETVTLQIGD